MSSSESSTIQYKTTDTNMHVDMLGNSEKLKPQDQRWYYNSGQDNDDLDDPVDSSDHQPAHVSSHHNSHNSHHSSHHSDKPDISSFHSSQQYNDTKPKLSADQLRLNKVDAMRKLAELKGYGVTLSKDYSMDDDLDTMEFEYQMHRKIQEKKNYVKMMSEGMILLTNGIKMMNDKYNPFEISLSGWSSQVSNEIGNFYDILGEIYEKYHKPGTSIAPEIKLVGLLSFSAFNLAMLKNMSSMFGGGASNRSLNVDPNKIEQMRKLAVEQKLKTHNDAINNANKVEHNKANERLNELEKIKQQELEAQRQEQINKYFANQMQGPAPIAQQAPPANMNPALARFNAFNRPQAPEPAIAMTNAGPIMSNPTMLAPPVDNLNAIRMNQERQQEMARRMKELDEQRRQQEHDMMMKLRDLQDIRKRNEAIDNMIMSEQSQKSRSARSSRPASGRSTPRSNKSAQKSTIDLSRNDDTSSNYSKSSDISLNPDIDQILGKSFDTTKHTYEDSTTNQDDETSRKSRATNVSRTSSRRSNNSKKATIDLSSLM